MEVKDAIERQCELEQQLLLLIRAYCEQTGLVVTNVDIHAPLNLTAFKAAPVAVRCTVETP